MKAKQTPETLTETQIERLLRTTAADNASLSEPPADMVARALRNAPERRGVAWVMPRVVGAVVGVAAVCAVGAWFVRAGDLTPLPRVSMLRMDDLPDARASLGEGESKTTNLVSLPAKEQTTPGPDALVTRLPLSQRGTSVRAIVHAQHGHPGKGGEVSGLPHHHLRHPHHPTTAPLQVAERPTHKPNTQLAATSAVPHSRPFWHDEQVERDDYTVSAPAVLAEGTGNDVTSIQPALVQVSFSTTHPVADADDSYIGNEKP